MKKKKKNPCLVYSNVLNRDSVFIVYTLYKGVYTDMVAYMFIRKYMVYACTSNNMIVVKHVASFTLVLSKERNCVALAES